MSKPLPNIITAVMLALAGMAPMSVFAEWHQKTFDVMGTRAHVEFWLDRGETEHSSGQASPSAEQLIAMVEQEMQRIDRGMSPYIETSELSAINRQAGVKAVSVSAELFGLLQTSVDISTLTGGAFDITYASVGYQYDYRNRQKPSQAAIDRGLTAIDYQSLLLDEKQSSIQFRDPRVKIDLGGIAKGHAVKRCIDKLKAAGIKHALVSAGGDTGLLGDRRGRPWYVGVKHPRAQEKNAVHLPLSDEAISTSGDYERYFIEDGVRYHHIINPKTGDSARRVVSVSIVGQDPTYVDALSTAIFVKGLAEGMALINQLPGYEAIIIDKRQTLHVSSGLQQQ